LNKEQLSISKAPLDNTTGGKRCSNRKVFYLVLVLVSILAVPTLAQVKVYDNTLNLSSEAYYSPAGQCYGEFIHLDYVAHITAIEVGYYCPEGMYGGGIISLDTSLNQDTSSPMYSYNLVPGTNGLVRFDLGTDPTTNPFYNTPTQDLFLRFYFSSPQIGILTADSGGIGSTDATVYQAQWGPPAKFANVTPTTLDGRHLAIAVYCEPVPEPGTFAVLSSGLVGLLAFRRRRK